MSKQVFSGIPFASRVLACAAALAMVTVTGGYLLRANDAPTLSTDRNAYAAGDEVLVSGQGFAPYEQIQFETVHEDGTAEPGFGHEPRVGVADQNGMFSDSWFISADDTVGRRFVVRAAGTTSPAVQSPAFLRTPMVAADPYEVAASETTTISGRDFVPGETVTIQVVHADGTAEAGAVHEASSATVGTDGTFAATWSPDLSDLNGADLQALVSGSTSGPAAPAWLLRVGRFATDKGDYQPGETAILNGSGFVPGEAVQVQILHASGHNSGNGHEPFFVTANEAGAFTASWYVDPDDSYRELFKGTAVGLASNVGATAWFWDASASVSLTSAGYTHNFNTLASSGTNNTWTDGSTLDGWYSNRTTYTANTGASNAGSLYSYGLGPADRALGSVASAGSGTILYGVRFVNDTSSTITSLNVSFTGEQWRTGGTASPSDPVSVAQTLDFQYRVVSAAALGASALSDSSWLDANALDFTSPIYGTNNSQSKDGNDAANRTAKSGVLTGLSIPPGAGIWLRWSDVNDANNDHGLAIDDLSVSIASVASNLSINDVTLNEGNSGTTSFTFTVSLSAPAGPSGVTFDIATADSTATAGSDYVAKSLTSQTIPAGSSTYSFTVTVNGDPVSETNETFFVNLSNVIGAALADGQGVGTITNDDSADTAPSVASTVPADGTTNVTLAQSLTVTFDEAVSFVDAGWFSLSCSISGAHAASVTGGPTSFTLNPTVDFTYGEQCTLVVNAAKVHDQDGNDPPDAMVASFTTGFATEPDPCTLSFTPAYSIQGGAATSPLAGTVVTTQGVVVGDYEYPGTGSTSGYLRGFYLQDATGDGNPLTSDGLFVFNNGASAVSLGQVVRVTGTVSEFNGQTQVSATSASIRACGTGSVDPVDVELPVASADYLERYEGMLVRLPQTLSVTEHFQLGRFGQVVLSSGGRLSQPTNVADPGPAAMALQAQNALNRIILDDASQAQNPDPIVFARNGSPLSASNTLRGGDTATGIVGVLDYTWGGNSASPNAYRVRPIHALNGYVNFDAVNPRPGSVPSVGGTVKVVGMNLLNYFNTFGNACTGGVSGTATACRGADGATEFTRQAAKTVAAILAMDPDVLGVNEVENDGYGQTSALQDLVDRLNAAAGAGTYAFIDADAKTGAVDVMGDDAIKVALLYKPGVVTPVGQTAVLNTVDFVNAGDSQARNRPSLAQAFEVNATTARFIVDVNHLKSKGSACDAPDVLDGQGNCNTVRVNAVTELLAWLGNDPTGTGDPDILMVGDYNSYAKEDPIAAIEGAGFTNLINAYVGSEAYSYVFDGQWGYLDQALASGPLVRQVKGAADYHINADEPSVLDYNTDFKTVGLQASLYAPDQFRVSDHDPVIIGLKPNDPPVASAGGPYTVSEGSSVTLSAAGSTDPNSDPLSYEWDLDNDGSFESSGSSVSWSAASIDGPAGPFRVTVRVSDPDGFSDEASTTVSVVNVAPTVGAVGLAPFPSVEGQSVVASASFSDPMNAVDAPYTCTVNYGDGSGALAGVVSGYTCTGPSHVYSTYGLYTVTVAVSDKDGGVGSKTATQDVNFKFSGFFAPVDNLPVVNRVKAGQAIPLKFSLNGYKGLDILSSAASVTANCNTGVADDIALTETVTAGASTLQYDATTGLYIYVWKTEKPWAGQCRMLTVKLKDDTVHQALFQLK